MRTVSLALVGFGHVGKAFVRLLAQKQAELGNQYGLKFRISGVATARHGIVIYPKGLAPKLLADGLARGAALDALEGAQVLSGSVQEFIAKCSADFLFENTPVNYHTGQPAADYLRIGLEKGMHVVTANKGPVVHAYQELTDLASAKGRQFLFESAVMDGAPIFSVFREALPAARVQSFFGILNSCTNMILDRMETGETLDQAICYGQSIGIAETDPSGDVDGWDAAVKVAAIATVLMRQPLKPDQVEREGIRKITPEMISKARTAGEKWKLVCRAHREEERLVASVAPERVLPDSPLFSVCGTSSFVQFKTDVLPGLGILESDPGPDTTAYGLLADMLNILRKG